MGLTIDSMQQQANLVGTHSLSLRFESAYRTNSFMHSIYHWTILQNSVLAATNLPSLLTIAMPTQA